MNILFYTVSNKRSRDIESQAIEFARVGHRIFLLTQSPRSELHDIFEFKGFRAFDTNPSKGIFPLYLIGEIIKLVIFCYRHKITIVHSHLDPCNLVAVCSQLLLRAKVIVNRHHADALMYEASKKSQRISLWIYQRARYIIVVSENVKSHMVNEEGIKAKNVTVIPLSFNFELYDLPTEKETQEIRKKYATPLLLCTAGRFISSNERFAGGKRFMPAFCYSSLFKTFSHESVCCFDPEIRSHGPAGCLPQPGHDSPF